ncbi:hypothetical protein Tco_0612185 [Tanacetum coccineum]
MPPRKAPRTTPATTTTTTTPMHEFNRRQAPLAHECTCPDFMKCKPLYFKGTEGVVELTQWKCLTRLELPLRDCWSRYWYAMTWTEPKEDGNKYLPKGVRLRSLSVDVESKESDTIEKSASCLNVNLRTRGKFDKTTKINNNPQEQGVALADMLGLVQGMDELVIDLEKLLRSPANQNHGNQAGTGARGMVHALRRGETNQDLNDMEDDINA